MGLPAPLSRGDWRRPEFRENVRQKLEEVIKQSPNAIYRNAGKMEAYSYASSATKDEYLASVAQLIIQFKEKEPRNRAPPRSVHHVRPMMALRTITNRAILRRNVAAPAAQNAGGSSSGGSGAGTSNTPQVVMVSWAGGSLMNSPAFNRVVTLPDVVVHQVRAAEQAAPAPAPAPVDEQLVPPQVVAAEPREQND